MSIPSEFAGVPVVGWDVSDDDWLFARLGGLGASEVAPALGLSRWRTPWQVWAEKVDARRPEEPVSEAMALGIALEPWLLDRAAAELGRPVARTAARLYAHPRHEWRLCSPDGRSGGDLVECKTGGLAGGWGTPEGWTETSMPLTHELQCRWQMHVMDAPRVHLVALVAGMGVRTYTVERELGVEADLAAQASVWWERHVLGEVEPPLGGGDAAAVLARFAESDDRPVDLDDTDAWDLLARRRDAKKRGKDADVEVEEIHTRLKALLGPAWTGRLGNRVAYTWKPRLGNVDWQRIAADMAEKAGVPLPDPDTYRKPGTRALDVKDVV
jgi:putative phage-type endonuclease